MVHVILLDDYQGVHGPDNYAVTFSGTLAECRAQANHDGGTTPWLKSDYDSPDVIEPISLSNGAVTDDGSIVVLTPVSGDAVKPLKKAAKVPPIDGKTKKKGKKKPKTATAKKRKSAKEPKA